MFSGFFKTEVNDYIAFRSKARPEDFCNGKPSSRAKFAFYSLFRAITLPSGNAQEAERTVGVHFLGKETAGRYDFGGICRKILEGEEMLLSGAQGLFERKRVALRATLLLNNSSNS